MKPYRMICAILCSAAFGTAVPLPATAQDAGTYAYVGARTTERYNGAGKGIEVFRTGADGSWTHVETVDGPGNPSFLIRNQAGSLLFAVHGGLEEVTSFRIDPDTGSLTLLSSVDVGGVNPVHLALNSDESFLVVANYTTGAVVSLPVNEDGTLGAVTGKLDLPGEPGPHRQQQPSSYPHQVLADPSRQVFIVPDKGLDRVFVVGLDGGGQLSILSETATREGSGPRHGDFGKNAGEVYIVNELDSTITAYTYKDHQLTPFQIVSTLPDDFTSNSRAAAIDVADDGRHVYATNRGHESIVRFVIDPETGRLSDPNWVSSGGKRPRFMMISPSDDEVLVANELSHSIFGFRISEADGTLTDARMIVETGSPVAIEFGAAK